MKKIKYQDRVVCFLDMLGFKKHIDSTVTRTGRNRSVNIDNIISAIDRIRYYSDTDKPQEDSKRVTQFSDSVVISFLANEESGVFHSLLSIMWIQLNLVMNGILCRGGMVRGNLIHTDKYLFGPAMTNAYILESKAALYPRVILDASIIETGTNAHSKHHYDYHEKECIMNLLARDTDGMYYIDYITKGQSEFEDPEYGYPEYLDNLGEITSSGLRSHDPAVIIKYQWLREKYMPHIKGLKEFHKNNPDGDIQDAYLRLPEIE